MPNTLDHNQLREILPHTYPFLLIDRVEDIKEGESLVAVKNITANEWPFNGFSEDNDIFPETLLIEAAAQAALVLYHVSKVKDGPRPRYILGRAKARYFGCIKVGDQMQMTVSPGKMLAAGGYADISVSVGTNRCAKVDIIYSVK